MLKRFVPYEKRSKKQKSAYDAQRCILWDGNPVTRKTKNKKQYNRKKVQRIDWNDFTEPFSFPLKSDRYFVENPAPAA